MRKGQAGADRESRAPACVRNHDVIVVAALGQSRGLDVCNVSVCDCMSPSPHDSSLRHNSLWQSRSRSRSSCDVSAAATTTATMTELGVRGCAMTRPMITIVAMACLGSHLLLPSVYALKKATEDECPHDPLKNYLSGLRPGMRPQGSPIPSFQDCQPQANVLDDERWMIIAAGLPRAGSTWQSKAIQAVLQVAGANYTDIGLARYEEDLDFAKLKKSNPLHIVVKIHPHQQPFRPAAHVALENKMRLITFTSHRNVIDEIVSATGLEFGWIQNDTQTSTDEFRRHTMVGFKQASLYACSCCIMPFEQLSSEESMREELYRIANVLGLRDVLGTGQIELVLDHMIAFECQRNRGKQASSSSKAESQRLEIEKIVEDMPDLIEWQKSLGYTI